MRLRKTILPLFVANSAFGWNHATEAGFRKALRSNEYTLVAFVLPTQDASKALEPQWISIQETERDNNVVSFDCSVKPKLCDELDIASYPAIRLYRNQGEKVERYRGPRKAKPIVAFLRRALRPALSVVDSKNITSFLSIDDVVFVAHLHAEDTNLYDRYETLARQYHDRYSFAVARSERGRPEISCYNNPDDMQRSTAEFSTVESLENLVKLCSTPIIPELTRRTEQHIFRMRKSIVSYFASTDQEREDYVKEVLPLAKKYDEYLIFATIDTNEYPETLELFGHKPGSTKVLSVQNPANGDTFPYIGREHISAPVVEAFLIDIINGKVKPWSREGFPADDDEYVAHEEL